MIGFSSEQGIESFFETMDNALGIIAVAAIAIGFIGGLCLIGFRNRASNKAMVMMHIHGMQKKDVVMKAAIDAVIYGVISSFPGCVAGYFLFCHFSMKMMNAESIFGLVSLSSFVVFIKTLVFCAFIVFISNLFIDFSMMEEPFTQFLYKRKGKRDKNISIRILAAGIIGIAEISMFVFM